MQTSIRLGGLLMAAAMALAPAATAQMQTPAPPAPAANNELRPGESARVSLETQMDTRKLKVGDAVVGKLEQDLKEDGQTVASKNTRLQGKVVEVASRAQGAPMTRLALLFDTALPAGGGQAFPVYGVLFNVLGQQSDDGVERIQQFHLHMMQNAADRGEPIDPKSEIGRTLLELSMTARTGITTAASQQYSCTTGTLAGEIWCAPAGHTVLAGPASVSGLDEVYLQKERTPLGPMGVLISARKSIAVNRGTDLLVYFFAPPRK